MRPMGGGQQVSKPILERITVEPRFLVMIEDEQGEKRPVGPMLDMGHGGKKGLQYPPVSHDGELTILTQKHGFENESQAGEWMAKIKLYIEDILAIPPEKRAGSAKHWQ